MFQATAETPRLYFWSVGQSRGFHAGAVREGKGLGVCELLLKEVFLLESPLRNVTMVLLLITCIDKFGFTLRRPDHFQRKEKGWYGTRHMCAVGEWVFVLNGDLSDSRHPACSLRQRRVESLPFSKGDSHGAKLVGLPWACALTGSNSRIKQ